MNKLKIITVSANMHLLLLAMFFCSANAAEFVGVQGFSKDALVERDYPVDGTPLLDSFYFNFTGTDHHIQAIRVKPASPVPDPSPESSEPSPGRIHLIYKDKSYGRDYFYNVSHFDHLNSDIRRDKIFDFCEGSCIRGLQKPFGDYVFVITGFSFFFPGTDHHIDEMEIIENNGNVKVSYNDKNNDDLFKFELEYSYVPRHLIQRMGTVGRSNVKGGDSNNISSGDSVIRGFKLNFRSKDHEIKDIGVMTRPGKVEVFYGDKNQDDRFDWTVRWATLGTPVEEPPEEEPPEEEPPVDDEPPICLIKPYLPQCNLF